MRHRHCYTWVLSVLSVLSALLLLAGAGCKSGPPRPAAGPADWLAWQGARWQSLAGSNGWTTLVARHWLADGSTTFAGSDPTNELILPAGRVPAQVGRFTRHGRDVRFEAAPGVAALIDGQPVQGANLISDSDGRNAPTRLMVGLISIVVIERGERLGLRVRDPGAPARLEFKSPDYFPYDPTWRLAGRFEAFPAPRLLPVQDILGGTQELVSPGAIVFSRGRQSCRLDVVEEPGEEDYFILFRDRTAGASTYPSGRFLYVARPGPSGRVTIDFNRAYTPPCGFTPFAVCPLPPPQNWLPFAIHAGEKNPLKQLNN